MSLDSLLTILEYTGTIIGILTLIGGAIALVYGTFKQARGKDYADGIESENELTKFWKDQVEGFKEMLKAQDTAHMEKMRVMEAKIQALTTEVSNLNIKLNEKDKQIKLFQDLMAGKDDSTIQFRDYVIRANEAQAKYREETGPIFKELLAFMKNSNEQFEALREHSPTEMQINGTLTTTK